MSDPTSAPAMAPPPYDDPRTAAFVYFDGVAAFGTLNGAIQIELASRIMVPSVTDNSVDMRFQATGRLRCSPAAAIQLRDALQATLNMLEQPNQQQTAVAPGKLN